MDDQLLDDLYGMELQDQQDDDMIKAAQAELVEAVADEAGIDLAEMDDAELDKFASYVLSDTSDDVYTDPSLAEADQMGRVMAHAYADEQMKIAHQLQQDYLPEGDDMNDDLEYALEKQAHAWDLVKEAADMPKSMADRIALTRRQGGENRREMYRRQRDKGISRGDMLRSLVGRGSGFYDYRSQRGIGQALGEMDTAAFRKTLKDDIKADRKGYRDARDAYKTTRKNISSADRKAFRSSVIKDLRGTGTLNTSKLKALGAQMGIGDGRTKLTSFQKELIMKEIGGVRRGLQMRAAGKAGLVAGGLGLAGYGASRAMSKKSSYDPVIEMVEDLDGWEFAKEAELRAAEILLENGIDPETFEETYPESVKLASFPEPGDAYTYEGDEELIDYNEMLDDAAYDILEDLGF